jgi:hypothetical protein
MDEDDLPLRYCLFFVTSTTQCLKVANWVGQTDPEESPKLLGFLCDEHKEGRVHISYREFLSEMHVRVAEEALSENVQDETT